MVTRSKHSRAEQQRWVAKWKASGASAARFAARHRLNKATLYYWAKVTKDEASGPRGATAAMSRDSGFTEVRVRGAGSSDGGVIEIALPGGRVVRVHGDVDEKRLRVVLEAAGAC